MGIIRLVSVKSSLKSAIVLNEGLLAPALMSGNETDFDLEEEEKV